jgi:hypothetical protein
VPSGAALYFCVLVLCDDVEVLAVDVLVVGVVVVSVGVVLVDVVVVFVVFVDVAVFLVDVLYPGPLVLVSFWTLGVDGLDESGVVVDPPPPELDAPLVDGPLGWVTVLVVPPPFEVAGECVGAEAWNCGARLTSSRLFFAASPCLSR